MSKIFKKSLALLTAFIIACYSLPNYAFAASGGTSEILITGYEISNNLNTITKNMVIPKITIHLKKSDGTSLTDKAEASRLADNFSIGSSATVKVKNGEKIEFEGIKYSGKGNTLKFLVNDNGINQNLSISVNECKEYEEPTYEPPKVDPIPAPMVTLSRNEINSPIKENQEMVITVRVKNIGTSTMTSPIIQFTPSDSLFLPGTSSSIQLNNIAGGKEETAQIRIKAFEKITSQNQYLDAEVKFRYNNAVQWTDGSSSGRISIPAKVSKDKKDENNDETGSPVPNIIIKDYSYGGESIPAGEKFHLSIKLKNTSHKLPIENMVATVTAGQDFAINGSTNTFFFNKVKAGKSVSLALPMKATNTVQSAPTPISVNVKYEYVDQKKRTAVSTDLQVSVPVYQKDKFEIKPPTLPPTAFLGEENSFQFTYTNKGKGTIYNAEVEVSGDVSTPTPIQNLGNLEAGKNGTVSFAFTPEKAGKCKFKITVRYEDDNGVQKERVFNPTLQVEEAIPDEPLPDLPPDLVEEENKLNWPLIIGGTLAGLLGIFIFIKRRKKKKLAKKEAEMWSNWDDNNASETTKSEEQSTGAK